MMQRINTLVRGGAHLFSPAPATINTIIKPGNEKARRSGWVGCVSVIKNPRHQHIFTPVSPRIVSTKAVD
jgi:hypothetical protein